ncbi:MAG: hypothetical protein NTY03_04930 [Candidatus Bathyarchaeota archaeon]|nr:hypothetical protein [Candidatus Bathyarchaeota archaeon]
MNMETSGLKRRIEVPDEHENASVIPLGYPKQPVESNEIIDISDRVHIDA